MKHCDKCGVYYKNEHECGKEIPITACDVCGSNVQHFKDESDYVAMARHKASPNCLEWNGREAGFALPDMVNSPPHYRAGGVECIDAIRAALGHDGFIAYCRGNVIKYQFRADHKNGKEDLKKAVWYSRMAAGDDPRGDA